MVVLDAANEMAPEPMVPFTNFYAETLCRKLNFKAEYKGWLHTKEVDE